LKAGRARGYHVAPGPALQAISHPIASPAASSAPTVGFVMLIREGTEASTQTLQVAASHLRNLQAACKFLQMVLPFKLIQLIFSLCVAAVAASVVFPGGGVVASPPPPLLLIGIRLAMCQFAVA